MTAHSETRDRGALTGARPWSRTSSVSALGMTGNPLVREHTAGQHPGPQAAARAPRHAVAGEPRPDRHVEPALAAREDRLGQLRRPPPHQLRLRGAADAREAAGSD